MNAVPLWGGPFRLMGLPTTTPTSEDHNSALCYSYLLGTRRFDVFDDTRGRYSGNLDLPANRIKCSPRSVPRWSIRVVLRGAPTYPLVNCPLRNNALPKNRAGAKPA